ncbi:MAG: ribonucleoside-diphosphate reductase, adenosylcobalamin-dependent, partial [Ottowia sp.]|nr:ribonucleoside-diphosphate reductase, adenosylcobalamin-dependent [Ottowia sp.]
HMVIEKRPEGGLPAVAEKIEYWTQAGPQRLYIIVTFMPIATPDGGQVERAIEFFMPVGQSSESQQWITATMRSLSLAARGGFLRRALEDLRKVTWDQGPVRLGYYQKPDGGRVPRWHDSEVAAIAYAIECILDRRKNEVQGQLFPAEDLPPPDETLDATAAPSPSLFRPGMMVGRKCPECGARALIRKDGCDWCTQCGHLGACG